MGNPDRLLHFNNDNYKLKQNYCKKNTDILTDQADMTIFMRLDNIVIYTIEQKKVKFTLHLWFIATNKKWYR